MGISIDICKTKFKFCQILNRGFKNCQRLVQFCQSGEISPNLVTLWDILAHNLFAVSAEHRLRTTLKWGVQA